MSLQEDLLDNIEHNRSSIQEFQEDMTKYPVMSSFYRGMIAGYATAVRQMERIYEKNLIDQDSLEEIRQKYPIPQEFQ
jgi:ribosomal protein S17E